MEQIIKPKKVQSIELIVIEITRQKAKKSVRKNKLIKRINCKWGIDYGGKGCRIQCR